MDRGSILAFFCSRNDFSSEESVGTTSRLIRYELYLRVAFALGGGDGRGETSGERLAAAINTIRTYRIMISTDDQRT